MWIILKSGVDCYVLVTCIGVGSVSFACVSSPTIASLVQVLQLLVPSRYHLKTCSQIFPPCTCCLISPTASAPGKVFHRVQGSRENIRPRRKYTPSAYIHYHGAEQRTASTKKPVASVVRSQSQYCQSVLLNALFCEHSCGRQSPLVVVDPNNQTNNMSYLVDHNNSPTWYL